MVKWSPTRKPAYLEHAYLDCFLDREASLCFYGLLARDEKGTSDRIYAEIDQSSGGSLEAFGWANITLDPLTKLNCVIYRSGFEEGCVGSFLGWDARGESVCLTNVYPLRE